VKKLIVAAVITISTFGGIMLLQNLLFIIESKAPATKTII